MKKHKERVSCNLQPGAHTGSHPASEHPSCPSLSQRPTSPPRPRPLGGWSCSQQAGELGGRVEEHPTLLPQEASSPKQELRPRERRQLRFYSQNWVPELSDRRPIFPKNWQKSPGLSPVFSRAGDVHSLWQVLTGERRKTVQATCLLDKRLHVSTFT